jgi:hypothetical protein
MARMHGKNVRVYFGSRDISGDIHTVSPDGTAGVHEATTFASAGWHESDPGVNAWTAMIDGFYDPVLLGFEQQLEGLLGASTGILSVYDGDADSVGDVGFLGSAAILDKKGRPVSIGDLMKLSGSLKGSGKAGLAGKLLHPKAAETATANGTALDNAASSANGGRGTIHVTAVAGTPTFDVKIQHSTDNSVWADLITFTQVTAIGAETLEVTGTVNRYLRVVTTKTSGTSITYVAGFARY